MSEFDRVHNLTAAAAVAAGAGARVVVPLEDQWAAVPVGVRSTLAVTDDTVYFIPVAITRPCTIKTIAVEVTTGAASSTVRAGLYSATSLGAPNALIKEATATADTSTTGNKSITLSQKVDAPGLYFVAVKGDGAPTLRSVLGAASAPAVGDAVGDVLGATGEFWYAQASVATSLPSSPTVAAARQAAVPLVALEFDAVEA